MVPDGEEGVKLVISMDSEYPSDVENDEITYSTNNSRKIGQFHTLCADVPAEQTSIIFTPLGTQVGAEVTLNGYFNDPDFFPFYTKTITEVADNSTFYTRGTVNHILAGFKACDILPESVWCLNFHPKCKNWDGMVYCNDGNFAVDIYLQSEMGFNSKSAYGGSITKNRLYMNFFQDSLDVGKINLNFGQFIQASMGHPQRLSVSSDPIYTGGHSSNNLRFISHIGCEDCCGVYQQNVNSVSYLSSAEGNQMDGYYCFFGNGFDTFIAFRFGGAYNWSTNSGLYTIDGCGSYIGYGAENDMVTCANRSCCQMAN